MQGGIAEIPKIYFNLEQLPIFPMTNRYEAWQNVKAFKLLVEVFAIEKLGNPNLKIIL